MAAEHDLAVSFSGPCRYSVHFTEHVFEPANPVLIDALRRLEPSRRHRVLAVIDEGVERAHPHLTASLRRYACAHADHFPLLGEPLVVPGGER
jgi:3-dehydroquinate synthase